MDDKEFNENEYSGLDCIDIIRLASRKQKAYQRIILTGVEQVITDRETFLRLKKIILDGMNDYLRSFARALVGEDVER